MPLNSPEDYEQLGAHLAAIDAPLASFAATHGYTVDSPRSGGRYPNRRITQEGPMIRSIHISMADMPNGERFDHFFPEIPYTIYGGAVIDDHREHIRWHSPFLHTRHIPFTVLVNTLHLYLDHFHEYLSRMTADCIYACRCTSPLADLPSDGTHEARISK